MRRREGPFTYEGQTGIDVVRKTDIGDLGVPQSDNGVFPYGYFLVDY